MGSTDKLRRTENSKIIIKNYQIWSRDLITQHSTHEEVYIKLNHPDTNKSTESKTVLTVFL